jgi:hypothetical protein
MEINNTIKSKNLLMPPIELIKIVYKFLETTDFSKCKTNKVYTMHGFMVGYIFCEWLSLDWFYNGSGWIKGLPLVPSQKEISTEELWSLFLEETKL